MAKVSVVMCCYNSERYIKETIDSVLNQTFSDFEFIIWNDGSTDTTEQIIKSYNDERIKYFKDENKGEGMAAQLACRHATAKYIARIDSDDVWLPEKLALQYDYMEKHSNMVMISCPSIYIDKNSEYLGVTFPVTRIKHLKKTMPKGNRFPHSGSIYKSEAYFKVGGYNNIRLFQDALLFWKLADYGDVYLWPFPLIKYRLLSGSVSHRVSVSAYRNVILALRHKIYMEKGSNEKDIELFNSLYNLIEKDSEEYVYKDNLQNKFYKAISQLIGKKMAYKIIVFIKNSLCPIEYSFK